MSNPRQLTSSRPCRVPPSGPQSVKSKSYLRDRPSCHYQNESGIAELLTLRAKRVTSGTGLSISKDKSRRHDVALMRTLHGPFQLAIDMATGTGKEYTNRHLRPLP